MAQLTLEQAYQLAHQRYREGNLPEARQICEQLRCFAPKHGAANHLLGLISGRQGDHRQALHFFKEARSSGMLSPQLEANIGEAERRLGNHERALSAFKRALALDAGFSPALNGQGVVYRRMGRIGKALESFQKAQGFDPQNTEIQRNLAVTLLESNRFSEAVELYERLGEQGRSDAGLLTHWGLALVGENRLEEARDLFEKAVGLDPEGSRTNDNYGSALVLEGRHSEAVIHYRQAVLADPSNVDIRSRLCLALNRCGLSGEAIPHFREALKHAPDEAGLWSALLYNLQYSPHETEESIAEAFDGWREFIARKVPRVTTSFRNEPGAERVLRIGYVSPDLREHVMAQFILPLLEHHDPSVVEVYCYSEAAKEDGMTARCKSAAHHWRPTCGLSDEQMAKRILDDKIDILVDLAMHSHGNRLPALARKPAPILLTYLANIYTTGLEAVDYRLGDPYLDPAGWSAAYYSEETIRLPHAYWCYTPLGSPDVQPAPFLTEGRITFGCLNNFSKVNDRVLRLWARIMRAVPDSRLLLLVPDGEARDRVISQMEDGGIERERLMLTAQIPKDEYLPTYNRIDICLDPFPYQGITTTLDALWMSCPVVSFAGEQGVERVALSMLSTLEHAELVGRSLEEYEAIAIRLAKDSKRLVDLRSSLRQKLRDSPMMDAPQFVRDLEKVYRELWRRWVTRVSTK